MKRLDEERSEIGWDRGLSNRKKRDTRVWSEISSKLDYTSSIMGAVLGYLLNLFD